MPDSKISLVHWGHGRIHVPPRRPAMLLLRSSTSQGDLKDESTTSAPGGSCSSVWGVLLMQTDLPLFWQKQTVVDNEPPSLGWLPLRHTCLTRSLAAGICAGRGHAACRDKNLSYRQSRYLCFGRTCTLKEKKKKRIICSLRKKAFYL